MNLGQIRNAVLVGSDHSPNDTAYHQWLNTYLDQIHRELWDSKLWTFVTKTVDIPVFPDKQPSGWNDATLIVVQGQTAVTSTFPIFNPWDAGQIIEIEGLEYTIACILSTSTACLDQPFHGLTTEFATWRIKHRTIYLPRDCVEVVDVSWRDAPIAGASHPGSLIGLQPKIESGAGLGLQDTAAKPLSYVALPDYYIRTPEESLTPTLTLSTDSGPSFLGPGTYSFTYSYVLATPDVDAYGLLPESDPWPGTVTITVTAPATNTISFSVFNPQSKYSATDKPVRVKIYYVNTLYDGRTELQELRATDELGPLFAGTSGTVVIGADMFTPSPRPIRHPLHGGRTRCIRLWPRPNSPDITFEEVNDGDPIDRFALSYVQVTYIQRPEHLLWDSDTPMIPEEFHQLLVDRATAEVHLRKGNLTASRIYEQRYNDRIKLLTTRYGTQRDSMAVRGRSWGMVNPNNRGAGWGFIGPGELAVWRG